MSDESLWYPMLALWAVVIVIGCLVAYYGFRAYRSSRQRSMLALGTGFVFLSVGVTMGWWGAWFMNGDFITTGIACAGTLSVGFGLVLYSVRTKFG